MTCFIFCHHALMLLYQSSAEPEILQPLSDVIPFLNHSHICSLYSQRMIIVMSFFFVLKSVSIRTNTHSDCKWIYGVDIVRIGFRWLLKWTQVVTPLDLARENRVHIHYIKICAIILRKHAYCKWCSCAFQWYFSSLESECCLCWWLMVCLTDSATCICHKHTAATAFVGMFSETWSHLLTQTCFYLTDLEFGNSNNTHVAHWPKLCQPLMPKTSI